MDKKVLQWYPGHMKKADRQIREKLKLIDVVIEVLDARAPLSSRNPDIKKYTRDKKHVIVLNKADLADKDQTNRWVQKLRKEGADAVVAFNALDQRNKKNLVQTVKDLSTKPQIKCLVVGIPNVGKSTIINRLIGKKKTQIGNRPGVTKGQQWLSTEDGLMLLDTPGILWPKFEDQQAAEHLAWIGSLDRKLFEVENIAGDLGNYLKENYSKFLENLYGIEIKEDSSSLLFDDLAQSRNLIKKGSEYDYRRTSEMLLNDFQNGKIGPITIDKL